MPRRLYELAAVLFIIIALFVMTPLSPSILTGGDAVDDKVNLNRDTEDTGSGYDSELVEQHFLRMLNEERSRRGLQAVRQRPVLTEMGQSHAENMATHSYLGHVQPDGTTIRDRFENRGLLPECRLPIEGTDRYYPGAENAWTGSVNTDLEMEGGLHRVDDEESLARALFVSWMNSKGHREAMTVASADEAGLGLAITEEETAYVALELC